MQRQDIQEVHLIHAGEDPDTLLKPLARGIEKYFKQPDLVTYDTFNTQNAGSESVSEKVAEAIRDAKEKKIPSAVIISKKFLDTIFLNKNKDQLIELIVDDNSYSVFVPIWLGVDEQEVDRYSSRLAAKPPVRGENYATDSENFQILAETLVIKAWLGEYIPSEGDDSTPENHPEHLRSREPVESVDPSSVQEQPTTDVSDTHTSDHPTETATSTESRPANQQQEEDGSASCAAAMAGSGLHMDYGKALDKLDICEQQENKSEGPEVDPTQPHPSDAPNEAVASGEARPANQQQEEGGSGCCDKAIGAGGCHLDPEKGLSGLNHDAEDSCHGCQGVPSLGSRNTATASAPAGGPAAATGQPAAPAIPAGPAAAGQQVQPPGAPARPTKQKPANIPIPGAGGAATNVGIPSPDDSTDKELKSPIPENGHGNRKHKCPSSEVIIPPGAFYNGTNDLSSSDPSPPQDPQAQYMVDLCEDLHDDLKMKLDPQMPLIKNWRNFGSRNGIKNQELNYIEFCARQGQSPTVAVFHKLPHLTVKKFKEDCKFYKRMDVLEVMKRHGY
ncbi:PREDICTED: myosin tail region-interacting protein MTI1-like [Branchiostoma belcheri]|uniref:Myosin tail region-interacting protein MTI1-like n=1 Tax=Branchiostoma belcheri TaxID=7741 RepID=A0A6P4ZWB9_BRABE|nr:PREDICTED: myosin tail region-interacting protein MTI1-like [Branchiostoma belcheri]